MKLTVTGSCAVLACALAGAASAEGVEQSLMTAPGRPVPLTVETAITADCSAREIPETRVVVGPSHGAIALREGRLQKQGAGCPAAPGYVVVYIPDADFMGRDVLTIEVVDGAMSTTMMFDIVVEADPPPAAAVSSS